MSDIYISKDGQATVDLQAYSDKYDKRIAELEEKLAKELAMIPCRTPFSTRTIDGLACVCFVMPDGVDWSDCELRVPRKVLK